MKSKINPVTKTSRQEALDNLRKVIKPGDTLYTILRHVSTSGMLRKVSVFRMDADTNEPVNITWTAYHALDTWPLENDHTPMLKVGGCGMDVGFEVVYNLGRVLFPEGFKVEGRGRNGDTSGQDKDGGYALKQRWL